MTNGSLTQNEVEEGKKPILDFGKMKRYFLSADAKDLVQVIIQDEGGMVLMLASMDQVAFDLTVETKLVHLYSMSRKTPWKKGGTSGDLLMVLNILFNCEMNSLLLIVHRVGAGACHTKKPGTEESREGCYYREYLRVDSKPVLYPYTQRNK